jgi:hypothetical protein
MTKQKQWSAFDVDDGESRVVEMTPKTETPNHRTALDFYQLRALELSDPRSLIPIVEALGEIRNGIAEARFAKSDASDQARSEKRKVNKCKAYREASKRLNDLESAESVVALFLQVAKKIAEVA